MTISAKVRELREKRTAIYNQASAIICRAASERRDMTADEIRSVEQFHSECERLGAELEAAGDEPQPTRAGGRQQASSDTDAGGDHPYDHHQRDSTVTAETIELRSEQRCADWIRARRPDLDPELRDMTVGQYLRGMFAPRTRTPAVQRALNEGSDSAGGFNVPDILGAQLIDLMRSQNQVLRAGARTVPIESDKHAIAKLATDPTPDWRAENGPVAESDPTFAKVEFQPKSLAVFFKASQELIQDSNNLETELPMVLAQAMAQELDRAALRGSGSDNEPSGLDNLADVQSFDHDGALANYSPFIKARRMVLDENADPNALGNWIMAPKVEEELGALTDTTDQPLMVPPILNRPRPFTTLVASKLPTDLGTYSDESVIYGGAFSQLAIGMRLQVQIRILRELFAENLQIGFLAYMRADVQAIRPKQLIRITGVRTGL